MSAVGGELSYRARDAELRGAWRACSSAPSGASVAQLAEHARIPRGLAAKVWIVRELCASMEVLACWESGSLTSGQLLRLVVASPFDEEAQREAASSCSSTARIRLGRSGAGEP